MSDPMDDPPLIDAHAHVWDRTCRFIEGARYHPDYEAPIDTYLRVLDSQKTEKAVLVQPSFLGTDNTYLLAALRAHPGRLRGIVVVDPNASDAALDEMTAAGVIGLRYNLLSLPPSAIAAPAYRALSRRAAARSWWIEVQAMGPDWPVVLETLADIPRLMVDHLGRPSGPECPGLARLLGHPAGRLAIKLSAPYRQTVRDIRPVARALIEHVGPGRCLWGSDWPWTQYEGRHGYAGCLAWLNDWTTAAERRRLNAAAPGLLGF